MLLKTCQDYIFATLRPASLLLRRFDFCIWSHRHQYTSLSNTCLLFCQQLYCDIQKTIPYSCNLNKIIPCKLAFLNSRITLTFGFFCLVTVKPQMNLLILKETPKLTISRFAVPKNLSPNKLKLGGITVLWYTANVYRVSEEK